MPSHSYAEKNYEALLDPEELPKQWYNIVPDLPEKLEPMLNPYAHEPMDPKDFEAFLGQASSIISAKLLMPPFQFNTQATER